MEEITINDIQGQWIGDECALRVGLFDDRNFANFAINAEERVIETRELSISDITDRGTRFLIFNENISLEIWQWNVDFMRIRFNGTIYDLVLRHM